jgi:septum formation protein
MPTKTTTNDARRLVLGSTSRYRRELLLRLGLPFVVAAPDIDEAALPAEPPAQTAVRLAEAKARAVAVRFPGALVIGSDQIADCAGQHVGKPGTRNGAVAQLQALSGKTVVFHTGVALVDAASGRCRTALVDVASTFRTLSSTDIDAYLDREAPFDCAGSVKSEGLGIALFDRIESNDPTALVGLPLIALSRLLREEGVDVLMSAATLTG